uniref:Uncharacterized protein n=1 Tax=Haptolina brevifila TaxID=156173 RepID=A0A7S2IDL1_9EUKA|mmetsp:Transcript_65038/g.128612  ORF Transcript_65038/g.128612 Transcript_65038/m.128612 type:complete len:209 (+) Transcript_65038:128-754(+)|eukprot:CAMPEP_0174739352 /NCGR_PEP_ID=MMETSP1094-20130205/71438_1 /TAXON_ID=156173 /ORGANISM="Chrysochromulina brevifilum, Strain UTEX LB 985" /LENGTH=208 /DNA_ID=CAMNT_0015942905 /DNA_START=124 /DNA_END=750 /DNA_ORIENTATION=+
MSDCNVTASEYEAVLQRMFQGGVASTITFCELRQRAATEMHVDSSMLESMDNILRVAVKRAVVVKSSGQSSKHRAKLRRKPRAGLEEQPSTTAHNEVNEPMPILPHDLPTCWTHQPAARAEPRSDALLQASQVRAGAARCDIPGQTTGRTLALCHERAMLDTLELRLQKMKRLPNGHPPKVSHCGYEKKGESGSRCAMRSAQAWQLDV